MRYLATLLGLLLATLPAFSHNTKSLLAHLTQEMSLLDFLPGSVQTTTPTHLKIIYLPNGALARWNAKTDTFEVSKAHWKKSSNEGCLLPLFVHESIHAWLTKQAREAGFAWPITLEDETIAFYYQLKTEETLPAYAEQCTVWYAQLAGERRALSEQNWSAFQIAIYERYSQFNGKDLPPPPFTQPWIAQAQHNTSLVFYKHTYQFNRRTLSANRFWRKGGNWLKLSPATLVQQEQDPHYLLYKALLVQVLSLPANSLGTKN